MDLDECVIWSDHSQSLQYVAVNWKQIYILFREYIAATKTDINVILKSVIECIAIAI